MERESMEFDVVIVGAGPAGLSAACRLMQAAKEKEQEITVCVVEKGSEVGAHILSGAVFEPKALDELFPNWKELGAPLHTEVKGDDIFLLSSETKGLKIPNMLVPKTMHNEGNYIISLGNLCRWLAEQAENLGVEIFPGFAAAETIYHEDGAVKGILIGDMGLTEAKKKILTCLAWNYMLSTRYLPKVVADTLVKSCKSALTSMKGKARSIMVSVLKNFGLFLLSSMSKVK